MKKASDMTNLIRLGCQYGKSMATLACGLILAGCALPVQQATFQDPPFQNSNSYSFQPVLPGNIKRVAVLPLVCGSDKGDMLEGRDDMEPVLRSELIKAGKFEIVSLDSDALRLLTGKARWSAGDELPGNFFTALQEESGCDAVLFCQLTSFRPSPPMAVGWRFRLVEVRTQHTLWAADELFDAGNPATMGKALRYEKQAERDANGDQNDWTMLNSPRAFGEYAVAELLGTLPVR